MIFRYCPDCGLAWGDCDCKPCTQAPCMEVADASCQECGSPFCDAHLLARPGHSHTLRWCDACRDYLATFAPCAATEPGAACWTWQGPKTYAPELLHDCADCHGAFCARCIVASPVSGTIRMSTHRCHACHAKYTQPSAA